MVNTNLHKFLCFDKPYIIKSLNASAYGNATQLSSLIVHSELLKLMDLNCKEAEVELYNVTFK